jgi:hypothetical protein
MHAAASNTQAQTSDQYIWRTSIGMRSGQFVAPCQDTGSGEGWQVLRSPVHHERSGLPDLGGYISRFEGRSMTLGPSARQGPTQRL